MNQNREARMRADFTKYVRLEIAIVHCTMTDELVELIEQQAQLTHRWTRRKADRRQWSYLAAAYRRAQARARWGSDRPFYRNGERAADAAIHQRSLNQAHALTAAERTRPEPQRRTVASN